MLLWVFLQDFLILLFAKSLSLLNRKTIIIELIKFGLLDLQDSVEKFANQRPTILYALLIPDVSIPDAESGEFLIG